MIVGDGPALEAHRLEAANLGLTSVTFTGRVEHSQLPVYYQACDCYVTASLSENYSISTLEAMASGLPVVHLSDPPNEYQYRQGLTGFTFETDDQLRQILLSLAAQPTGGREAHKQAVRLHTSERSSEEVIRRMLELYEEVMTEYPSSISGSAGVEIKLKR